MHPFIILSIDVCTVQYLKNNNVTLTKNDEDLMCTIQGRVKKNWVLKCCHQIMYILSLSFYS